MSDVVLRPMHRMLSTAKTIALPLLTNLGGGHNVDLDRADDEIFMFEQIVEKLGMIAGHAIARQNSAEENKHVQLLLGPRQESTQAPPPPMDAGPVPVAAVIVNKHTSPVMLAMRSQLEKDLHIKFSELDSYDFNMMRAEQKTMTGIGSWLIKQNTTMFAEVKVEQPKVDKFCQALCESYPEANIFHNWCHGADVIHTLWRFFSLSKAHTFLSALDQFALLTSALGHDAGHIGVGNLFLTETGHELAIRYNDKSPLENLHCSTLFSVISSSPDVNIVESLSRQEFFEFRRVCVAVILHTDMIHHFSMIKEAQMLYEMNLETFELDSNASNVEVTKQDQLNHLFQEKEAKQKVMNLFLHTADISNPCKPWDLCYQWSMRCLDEFFAQGDQEKSLGVPVGMLNDRHKVNRNFSQIGFIEFMLVPIEAAKTRLFPTLYETSEYLEANMAEWARRWIEETVPTEEEKEKVLKRCKNVAEKLQAARAVKQAEEPEESRTSDQASAKSLTRESTAASMNAANAQKKRQSVMKSAKESPG
eukprot:gnl/TRDRNA2_/TRDRNA2_161964_c5_seq1.p1 gnl/TRDRNA2_/TRDRNA2_161964_c5~~gnl/TRDRNA2_/TRDRNA2_161964_c5_seq1.p1  ORF type:complete len:572 (-),score=142.73 gnl/TRDRNA2_/TRDRNA2_161964_c5_seq1:203-1801(-)